MALAAGNWERARPLLDELRAVEEPFVATEAAALLYEYGTAEERGELRPWLSRVGEDRGWPADARGRAIRALMSNEWDDREAWFRRLLEREALDAESPVWELVDSDPKRWLPLLTDLALSGERATRDAGVQGLCSLLRLDVRALNAAASKPLLPWLSDPGWSACDQECRGLILGALWEARLLDEALPGIVSILERGRTGDAAADVAIWVLAAYPCLGDPRALPALRLAIARADSSDREALQECLEMSGEGLNEDVLAFLRDLESKKATASDVVSLIRRRRALRFIAPELVAALVRDHGVRAGLAALLLGKDGDIREVLSSADVAAQAMLLASARAGAEALPVPVVAPLLLSADPMVARAAELYLEAADTPEARAAVLSVHPGEARILGFQLRDPGDYTPSIFDRIEADLRREVLAPGGPHEIVGLLSACFFGGTDDIVIRIWGTEGTISISDELPRFRVRPLLPEEWTRLSRLLDRVRSDALLPVRGGMMDGVRYHYLRFGRNGGRRLQMDDPRDGVDEHAVLVRGIEELARAGRFEHHYELERRIPGSKVLFADREHLVCAAWADGQDVRVLAAQCDPEDRWTFEGSSWYELDGGQLGGPAAAPDGYEELDPRAFAAPDGNWTVDERGRPRRSRPSPDRQGPVCRPVSGHVHVDGRIRAGALWRAGRAVDRTRVCGRALHDRARGRLRHADRWRSPAMGRPWPLRIRSSALRGGLGPAAPGVASASRLRWAAVPVPDQEEDFDDAFGRGEEHTDVGLYDARAFTFRKIMTLPRIWFGSSRMWVDEEVGRILVAHRGQLLMVPLPAGWRSPRS